MNTVMVQFPKGEDPSNQAVELSRVPCVGEKLNIADVVREIKAVTHLANKDTAIVEVGPAPKKGTFSASYG